MSCLGFVLEAGAGTNMAPKLGANLKLVRKRFCEFHPMSFCHLICFPSIWTCLGHVVYKMISEGLF